MMNNVHGPARRLILAGFVDFMTFLCNQDTPMIIGGGYPREKIIDAFQKWADERSFNTHGIDLEAWYYACQQGMFKD